MSEISKTADQALRVLVEVATRGPRTPAELARLLGLNRTVVHRLLATLHGRGLVAREGAGYVPGAILLRMADRVEPQLRRASRPAIVQLAGRVGETVVLHVADGDDAVVLDQVVPDGNVVRVEHEIGSRHRLALGASGRAMLAFSPQPEVDRALREHERSAAIQHRLSHTRDVGYALSHDELQEGVHGLAVPVLDGDDAVRASLAILVPTSRSADIARHLDALRRASASITAELRATAA